MSTSTMSPAERLAANDAAGVGEGQIEAPNDAAAEETDDALAERAEALAAEQALLDGEDRDTPDMPEGAADDVEPAYGNPEEPVDLPTPSELAERLRNASGIAGDEDEARGEPDEQDGGTPEPAAQLTLHAGGAQPNVSEFKLNGRSLDLGVSTQFKKGSKTEIRIVVEWPEIDFIDKHDKETGQVTDTIRRHKGKIVSYELEGVDA